MYYGFDIGGTKIALGVFDSSRQLQWEKRVPTPSDSYDAFLDAVCELVSEAVLKTICLVVALRGCINTIIINRCRLPRSLRFMIKAMSRQGRMLSVIWIY